MRNCSERSSRYTTLALTFRIPHSAFRIRLIRSALRIPHWIHSTVTLFARFRG